MRYDNPKKMLRMMLMLVIAAVLAVTSVSAVTYITKSTGSQYINNLAGLYNDSGTNSFFKNCSAGSSIRVIAGDGSVTCESDLVGGGTMSYWNIGADTGTPEQVNDGEYVYVYGGSDGIDTSAGATNKVTLTFDGAEVPSQDIPESAISFSTYCTGTDKILSSSGDLYCYPEADAEVGTITQYNVCYGNSGSDVECNEGSAFYWDATNKRLGLGTSTPGVKLNIYGTGDERMLVSTSVGNNAEYNLGSGSNYYNLYIAGSDSNKLKFYSSGDRFTLSPSGLVGVNTTTPGGALEVRYSGSTMMYAGIYSGGTYYGVYGQSTPAGRGVYGSSGTSGAGVKGYGSYIGLNGEAVYTGGGPSTIYGVYGSASGASTDNWGGYFNPDVYVNGELSVPYINYYAGMPSYLYIGQYPTHTSDAVIYGNLQVSGTVQLGIFTNENEYNTVRLPTVTSPPVACGASYEGMMYLNASALNQIWICVSNVWTREYTPKLLSSEGRSVDYLGIKLKQTDGVAKVFLNNYSIGSEFSFYVANTDNETEFFDEFQLNMRCYSGEKSMTTKTYRLADDTPNIAQLENDDDDFLVLRKGDSRFVKFEQPAPADAEGCDDVEFEFVASGYYELNWVNLTAMAEADKEAGKLAEELAKSQMPKKPDENDN